MKYIWAHRVPIILTCQTDTCASELLTRHSFKKRIHSPSSTRRYSSSSLLPLCCSSCSSGVPWRKPWCDLVQTMVDSAWRSAAARWATQEKRWLWYLSAYKAMHRSVAIVRLQPALRNGDDAPHPSAPTALWHNPACRYQPSTSAASLAFPLPFYRNIKTSAGKNASTRRMWSV